jgi:hypothetical protein
MRAVMRFLPHLMVESVDQPCFRCFCYRLAEGEVPIPSVNWRWDDCQPSSSSWSAASCSESNQPGKHVTVTRRVLLRWVYCFTARYLSIPCRRFFMLTVTVTVSVTVTREKTPQGPNRIFTPISHPLRATSRGIATTTTTTTIMSSPVPQRRRQRAEAGLLTALQAGL